MVSPQNKSPHLSLNTMFKDYAPETQVFVAHPAFEHFRLLLGSIANDNQPYYTYVRLEGRALSESNAVEQIGQRLAEQNSSFDTTQTLILDEGDRVEERASVSLIQHLFTLLPAGSRVVWIARRLPYALLEADSARVDLFPPEYRRAQDADVPSGDEEKTQRQQTQHAQPGRKIRAGTRSGSTAGRARVASGATRLEVRAFGAGRAVLNGRVVDHWDGILPRALFFYMVDKGLATRNDIFSVFWPELSHKAATNVFHVTKRKLKDVLGIELTHYGGGYYRLDTNITLDYDVTQFLEAITVADQVGAERASDVLQGAVRLYRSGYLTSMRGVWTHERRAQLQAAYTDVLVTLSRHCEERQDNAAALGLLLRALRKNPTREDIARQVMMLYIDQKHPQDALAVYQRLEGEMMRLFGMQPGESVHAIADGLQGGRKRKGRAQPAR